MVKKKNKNTRVYLIILYVLIGLGLVIRDSRLVARDKPNIFEIPGTAYMHCVEDLDSYQYECHFMVQKLPDRKSEVKAMVEEFLRDDIVQELFGRDFRTTTLSLWFYVPRMELHVYFEENKNYFKMDDSIDHYEDNLFLVVTYDGLEETNFLFKDATLERLKINSE